MTGRLLATVAGSAVAAHSDANGESPNRPYYPQTAAELAESVTPSDHTYRPYDWVRYGADPTGVADSSPAIQAALNSAGREDTAAVCSVTCGRYRCDSGLSWDSNKITVDLNGSTLDFRRMTSGHAIQFTNSHPSVNVRPLLNATHGLRNGCLIGPGVGVTAVDAIYINDNTADSQPGLRFTSLSFQDFATDARFVNGVSFTVFDSCMFTLLSGTATTYSIVQQAGRNTGERNTFINCTWFNKPLLIDNLATVAADINCIGCSFDYFKRAFSVTGGGGSITVIGGHIEADTDTDNWGFVAGSISALILIGVTFSVTGDRLKYDLFWSDSTAINGGVFIRDCFLGTGPRNVTRALVGGPGNARIDNLIQNNLGAHPVLAASLNRLAYGGFEDPKYGVEWTLGGAVPAVRSRAKAHTGEWSLSLPGRAGNLPTAMCLVPCGPGQYMQGEYWYLCPTMEGTGGTLVGEFAYLDKGGNALSSHPVLAVTRNTSEWTRAGFKSLAPAPPGTAAAGLSFRLAGNVSGDATSYVDDVIANVV